MTSWTKLHLKTELTHAELTREDRVTYEATCLWCKKITLGRPLPLPGTGPIVHVVPLFRPPSNEAGTLLLSCCVCGEGFAEGSCLDPAANPNRLGCLLVFLCVCIVFACHWEPIPTKTNLSLSLSFSFSFSGPIKQKNVIDPGTFI